MIELLYYVHQYKEQIFAATNMGGFVVIYNQK